MSRSSSREVGATHETHGKTSTHSSATCTTKAQSFLHIVMSHIISLNQFCKQLLSYPPPSARKLLLGQTEFEAFVFVCSRSPQKKHAGPEA